MVPMPVAPVPSISSWAIAAESTWSAGCLIAFAALWFPSASKRPRVMRPYHRLLFCGYLISHVLSSMLRIVMITISGSPVTCASPEARDATIHFLDFLSRLLVVSAANFMVFLSAKLLAPRQLVVNRRAQAVLLAIFCVCATRFAALHFGVPGCAANDFVVLIYAAACALAFMGVLSVVSQHRKSWQAIVFLLASIAGIVNATVPLHVPADVTWQPHFLARLLDVIFWLPGAIIALRWLDSLPA